MTRIGIVGVGFMGMTHYRAYRNAPGATVTAICEKIEKRRLGDWTDIQGNFGPRGEMMDLSGVAAYAQLDDLLADDSIDLVDICLPPAAHCEAVLKSLDAGKHVLCEKPLALTVADAQRMATAAKAAGRLLMVGHVLPFFPEFAFAHEAVSSGRYGKPLGGHFKRVTADPTWLSHYWDPDIIGGPLLDLHIHDAHFIRLLYGMPVAVTTQGRFRGEMVEYFSSQFAFEDPSLVVTAASGAINQQGRQFTHGYEMHFERATLQFDLAVMADKTEVLPATVILNDDGGKVERPELGDGDPVRAFDIEMAEVVKAVESNAIPPMLRPELAVDAIRLCYKETESARLRRTVEI